jgi:hypothetical protein
MALENIVDSISYRVYVCCWGVDGDFTFDPFCNYGKSYSNNLNPEDDFCFGKPIYFDSYNDAKEFVTKWIKQFIDTFKPLNSNGEKFKVKEYATKWYNKIINSNGKDVIDASIENTGNWNIEYSYKIKDKNITVFMLGVAIDRVCKMNVYKSGYVNSYIQVYRFESLNDIVQN